MNKIFRGDERDWTIPYAKIGEFVVEFEDSVMFIRIQLCSLLQFHGLRNWRLSEIVFNSPMFSAEPLLTTFRSLATECLGPDHEAIVELTGVSKEFFELCRLRNDILHGTYLIGPHVTEITDNDLPKEMSVQRRNPDSKGHRVRNLAETLEEYDEYINEAKRIRELIWQVLGKTMVAIIKNLDNSDDSNNSLRRFYFRDHKRTKVFAPVAFLTKMS